MADLRLLLAAFACLSVTSATNTLRQHGCSPYADVVFIIDGSESIRRTDFDKTKTYVKGEVVRLNVFPGGAHIAVIAYSDDVSTVIEFSDNRNVAQLESDIMAIHQPRRGTNTASALREAGRLYGTGRSDATKIIVLITDGDVRRAQRPPPKAEADNLKRQNISIIAVGVGPYANDAVLQELASKPGYVKKVENFKGLDMLKLPYHEVCPHETTTPMTSTEDCRQLNGNIVFIFDGSESINEEEETMMKDFIIDQIDRLQLGSGRAGMGLVLFSNDASTEIRLSNAVDASSLKNSVRNLRLPSQGSNIAAGIEEAQRMFERYGNREQNRVAVLITDGVSIDNRETEAVADRAKRAGIEMVAIGVGQPGQIDADELKRIASEPTDRHVFTPTTFDEFQDIDFASELDAGFSCDPLSTTTSMSSTRTSPTTTTSTRTSPTTTTSTRTSLTTTTSTRTSPTTTTSTRTPPTTTPFPSAPGHPICSGCRVQYGAGFARHNSSCDKFIRCTIQYLGNGQVRAFAPVVFDCPRGLVWDQEDTLTCRYPSQVNCPLDRCRTEPGLKAYGDPTDCRVYWVCSNGYAQGKRCCPENQAFDDARGECVNDAQCVSAYCQVGTGGGTGDCHFTADSTDERYFLVNVNGARTRSPCPAGLAFVQETCGCHKRIALPTAKPMTVCEPDVYLPFDEDIRDHSGWQRGVGNSGAEVEAVSGAIGGGAGKFDGSDSVWIYRYNNMDFPPYVEIRFRFQETAKTSGRADPEALVTNGNCGDKPSLAISSTRQSQDVSYFTETRDGSATTQTSYRGGWTEVRYIYDRRQVTGNSASSTQSADLTGVIRRTHSPIIIGHGDGFQNFTGYIDEFYVYFCEP